jgi:hypothetical protein
MADTGFDSLRVASGPVKPRGQVVLEHYAPGAQTVGAKKKQWIAPFDGSVIGVRARLDTAPTGATAILDVNKNGTTMFTTQGSRPTIAISGNDSTVLLPDVVAFVAGDRLSYDIDQVGSGVAGSDLTVALLVKALTVD